MAYATYPEFETAHRPSAVYWLIGLCVGVYFVQATLVGDANMARWFGYAPGDFSRHAPWTVVTYMFVHGGMMHLLLNMWTLWIFGPRVELSWGSGTFTWFYLWCGLGGWAFHYFLQGNGGILIGASAAILGVAVAYASLWPNDEVLFFGVVPMKVRWLVVFMALINITMVMLDSGSMGGTAWAAHIGGMAAGWVYLRAPNVRSLDRLRRGIESVPDYGDDIPRMVPRGNRPQGRGTDRDRAGASGVERDIDDIVAQSKAAIARVRPSTPARKDRDQNQSGGAQSASLSPQSAFDAVLDKIASHGMESLTSAERLLLDEWSRRLRGDGDNALD